ncbi:unnamed protein product [Tilletia caries]|nr:unnamed protein product [Tilletia caries]
MFALSRSAANEFGPSTPGAAAVAAAAPSASTSIRPHLVGQQAQELHSTATCTRLLSYADVAKINAPAPTSADPAFLEGSYNQPPTDGHGASDIPSAALPQRSPHPVRADDPRDRAGLAIPSCKPKGVVHSTAGYLLGTALTVKHVFDVHEDGLPVLPTLDG